MTLKRQLDMNIKVLYLPKIIYTFQNNFLAIRSCSQVILTVEPQ